MKDFIVVKRVLRYIWAVITWWYVVGFFGVLGKATLLISNGEEVVATWVWHKQVGYMMFYHWFYSLIILVAFVMTHKVAMGMELARLEKIQVKLDAEEKLAKKKKQCEHMAYARSCRKRKG